MTSEYVYNEHKNPAIKPLLHIHDFCAFCAFCDFDVTILRKFRKFRQKKRLSYTISFLKKIFPKKCNLVHRGNV